MLVVPVAGCLIQLHTALKPIVGRDVPWYVDESAVPYQCPCHAFYISTQCCGSRDGVVHVST